MLFAGLSADFFLQLRGELGEIGFKGQQGDMGDVGEIGEPGSFAEKLV